MLKKMITIAFTFSRPSMNRLCHSRTRVRDITLSPNTSLNSWKHSVGVFQFQKKFQIDALLEFHPSHESGKQHNMVTLKQSLEQTN
jgi:hypothetical protein